MKRKFTTLVVMTLMLNCMLLAQPCDPLLINSSTVTAANCPGSGSITVSASGTGLVYKIISGPSGYPTANNSTGIFNSLGAGTYTIQVKDDCDNTITVTKEVLNSYPVFSVSNAAVTGVCESGTMGGTITATTSGGRPNYQYDIVPLGTNPVYNAPTSNSTYSENVTAFGSYRVYVKDACGEIRTYDVDVKPTQPIPTNMWYHDFVIDRPCAETIDGLPTITWILHLLDQNGQRIDMNQMIGSTFQIYKPNPANSITSNATNGDCAVSLGNLVNSGTVTAANINQGGYGVNMVMPQEDVILVFTNKCGFTFKYCLDFNNGNPLLPNMTLKSVQQSCGATWAQQNISIYNTSVVNMAEPITYVLTKNGGGTSTNSSGNFYGLLPADLPASVTATDVCGRTVTKTISALTQGSALHATASQEYGLTCTNIRNAATALVTIDGGDFAGYADGSVTITGGTVTAPPAISPFMTWIPGWRVSNLLGGYTYRINITNSCGQSSFVDFTVPLDQWGQPVLNWNLTATANSLCGQNKSNIIAKANYSSNNTLLYSLYNLTAPNTAIASNNNGVFNNVPPGNYKVKFVLDNSAPECSGQVVKDSVNVTVIDDSQGQSITNKTITTCEINGVPTTSGKAIIDVNGTGPFTYEIIKTSLIGTGASEVWTASSTNNPAATYSWDIPVAGDPANTMYTLRSTDNCGNKITTQASLQPFEAPVLLSQTHPCSGVMNYTLTIKPYAGNFTYRWVRLPDLNTVLSSQNTLTFPGAYTPANDGTYRCFVSLNGCVERVKDIRINSAECGATLPLTLISFNGNYDNSVVKLKWISENEIGCSHFDVERSTNGVDFIKVDEILARNLFSLRSEYNTTDNPVNISTNVLYYRLKMVDLDGKFVYSTIIRLGIKGSNVQLVVYPNPTKNIVSIALNSTTNTKAEIKVIDKLGRIVIKQTVNVTKGNNAYRLAETEKLPGGIYVVEVNSAGQTQTSKFMKY